MDSQLLMEVAEAASSCRVAVEAAVVDIAAEHFAVHGVENLGNLREIKCFRRLTRLCSTLGWVF